MKKFIINKCMNYIIKNTDYDKTKLSEIKYGLEGIYLTFSKTIVILILAFILSIEKEMLIYMLIYNIIRIPSFGLHATKSWICLLSSTILFIGVPYLCIILTIPIFLKVIIGIVGIYLMFKNAPADTKKRPIVNKKRRKIYKIISTLLATIFVLLSSIIKDNFISNCFLLALVMQNCMISPAVYKIFRLPYNNYITFLKEHPEFQQ
ncbi:MAG: accessory gene regulator B family protein [Bacilli bacterium]|nr:accessory gene regulator B family protein [Bacilli bacterium]